MTIRKQLSLFSSTLKWTFLNSLLSVRKQLIGFGKQLNEH